jgi:hypothetical protein
MPVYNVPTDNWLDLVKPDVDGYDKTSYNIGVRFKTPVPTGTCKKNFTAVYKCGNGPQKNVSVAAEANGKLAEFDCKTEAAKCGPFKLTLGDDGNLVLTNGKTEVWTSNTVGKVSKMPLEKYKQKNGKNKRNYLLQGEILELGEFIGSPSGNCYLIMDKDASGQAGLQLRYDVMADCSKTTPTPSVQVAATLTPDKNAQCKEWAQRTPSECKANPNYMLPNCATSCAPYIKPVETNNGVPNKGDWEFQGCYNDGQVRALPNQAADWQSMDQCIAIAEKRGHVYAAKQYNYQCFTGNAAAQFDKYGKTTCGPNGDAWKNSVWKKKSKVEAATIFAAPNVTDSLKLYTIPKEDKSLYGKMGYVSEDGKLHEYPADMLGPSKTFQSVGKYNSVGHDLSSSLVVSPEQCKQLCAKNEKCVGFVYGSDRIPLPMVRYVKVNNAKDYIQISQLVVKSGGENVALKKPTTSLNVYGSAGTDLPEASKAVDGTLSTRNHPELYNSAGTKDDYWEVDLGREYPVDSITYYNRKDCCQDRANGMIIHLLSATKTPVKTLQLTGGAVQKFNMELTPTDKLNKNCFLKGTGIYPEGLRVPSDNLELYVRGKAIKNHASCNKTYVDETPLVWENYEMGDKMSMSTLCNLGAFTEKEQKTWKKKHMELTRMAGNLKQSINTLASADSAINNKLNEQVQKLTNDSKIYAKIQDEKFKNVPASRTVDGMKENAILMNESDLYKNVLWSIVAVIFVGASVKVLRNISKGEAA